VLIDRLEEYYAYFSQRKSGWFILSSALLLTGLGIVTLSSASLSFIRSEDYFLRQLLWCAIGIPFFLGGCLVKLDFLRRNSGIFLLIFAVALVVVLIPSIGKFVNGSRRWISVGGVNVQVSEFAKIAVIAWIARYLEGNSMRMGEFFRGFFVPIAVTCAVCCLILLEPDYGTAILVGAVVFTLLLLAGAHLPYMLVAMACGVLAISVLIYLNPTRMRRIVAFLDVENNRFEGAYQLWQGMLGFVSGGLFGCGIGQGRQHLSSLPEAHTDFIFPVFGEEFGGLAATAVLLAYAALFVVASNCAKKLSSDFAKFLAYGIAFTIAYQVIINVGVVTGLLPTKGMVLPFISYGGSNLVLLFFMTGLLLNCFSSKIDAT
jgi:cell division protein FtsW